MRTRMLAFLPLPLVALAACSNGTERGDEDGHEPIGLPDPKPAAVLPLPSVLGPDEPELDVEGLDRRALWELGRERFGWPPIDDADLEALSREDVVERLRQDERIEDWGHAGYL